MMTTKMIDWKKRNAERRRSKDADQVEFTALRYGKALYQNGIQDDRIADDELIDPPVETGTAPMARFGRQDRERETRIGEVREEIISREKALSDLYPFKVTEEGLCYIAGRSSIYEFCLCTSVSSSLTRGCFAHLPRIFERVSGTIIASGAGTTAKVFYIGAPRDRVDTQPVSFKDAFNAVERETDEWHWSPQRKVLNEEPKHGDEGCDFIIWIPSSDGRKVGQLFFIGQCACGNDWDTKLEDLNSNRLALWLEIPQVPPVRIFATSFVLGNTQLYEASQTAGVTYDRLRLAKLASQTNLDDFQLRLRNARQVVEYDYR